MQDKKPMHRLLQGDVGSGKTVVSALALAKCGKRVSGLHYGPDGNSGPAALRNIAAFLEPAGISCGF